MKNSNKGGFFDTVNDNAPCLYISKKVFIPLLLHWIEHFIIF